MKGLITLFLVLVFVMGCSSNVETDVQTTEADSGLAESSPSSAGGSERARFIEANIEMSCYAMEGDQFGTTGEEGDIYVEMVQKHGFSSLDELESLNSKYSNTQTEIGQGMMVECPEVMNAMNQMADSLPSDPSASADINDWK